MIFSNLQGNVFNCDKQSSQFTIIYYLMLLENNRFKMKLVILFLKYKFAYRELLKLLDCNLSSTEARQQIASAIVL